MFRECIHEVGNRDVYGVEIRSLYDGVLYWVCDWCGEAWHEWPEGDWRRERAQVYIDSNTERMLELEKQKGGET